MSAGCLHKEMQFVQSAANLFTCGLAIEVQVRVRGARKSARTESTIGVDVSAEEQKHDRLLCVGVRNKWKFDTGADAHAIPLHLWTRGVMQSTSVTLRGTDGHDLLG